MNKFAQLIQEQVAARGKNKFNARGGALKLANELGVHNAIVKQWLDGADVRLSTLEKVLDYLGGDISRAFPDYKPQPFPLTRRNVPFLPHFTPKACQKRD